MSGVYEYGYLISYLLGYLLSVLYLLDYCSESIFPRYIIFVLGEDESEIL